jgi:transcriptional regulator of arginine metabolism
VECDKDAIRPEKTLPDGDAEGQTEENSGVQRKVDKPLCIFIQTTVYLCKRGPPMGPRLRFAAEQGWLKEPVQTMKLDRHNAIRELVNNSLIQSQNELRRKLRRRGFAVTQATLSRDLHEMHLFKGPAGYGLPNGNGSAEEEDDSPPGVLDVIETFGLRSRQAMNQVVIGTVMGGAQPVAAALDYEQWPEVLGTIAGDDTVLVICPDLRRAAEVQAKLSKLLEG